MCIADEQSGISPNVTWRILGFGKGSDNRVGKHLIIKKECLKHTSTNTMGVVEIS